MTALKLRFPSLFYKIKIPNISFNPAGFVVDKEVPYGHPECTNVRYDAISAEVIRNQDWRGLVDADIPKLRTHYTNV